MTDVRRWPDEPERCCDQDYGGSHYHCGGCGQVSGMMGCAECHRTGKFDYPQPTKKKAKRRRS